MSKEEREKSILAEIERWALYEKNNWRWKLFDMQTRRPAIEIVVAHRKYDSRSLRLTPNMVAMLVGGPYKKEREETGLLKVEKLQGYWRGVEMYEDEYEIEEAEIKDIEDDR